MFLRLDEAGPGEAPTHAPLEGAGRLVECFGGAWCNALVHDGVCLKNMFEVLIIRC